MFNQIYGLEVIQSNTMVENGEPYQINRTLKERLFSLPWEPLKATKTIVPMVPKKEILRMSNKLVMHPEVAKELFKTVESGENIRNRL